MNHSSKTRLKWAVLLSAAVMLAACSDSDSDSGGGGTAPPPAPPPVTGDVPSTAQASSTAWTAFVGAQTRSETGKGLDLTGVVAPFSETEAPQVI